MTLYTVAFLYSQWKIGSDLSSPTGRLRHKPLLKGNGFYFFEKQNTATKMTKVPKNTKFALDVGKKKKKKIQVNYSVFCAQSQKTARQC